MIHGLHEWIVLGRYFFLLVVFDVASTVNSAPLRKSTESNFFASAADDDFKYMQNMYAGKDIDSVESIMLSTEYHWAIRDMERFKNANGYIPLRHPSNHKQVSVGDTPESLCTSGSKSSDISNSSSSALSNQTTKESATGASPHLLVVPLPSEETTNEKIQSASLRGT